MSLLEYNDEDMMTRKEYIKTKKNQNKDNRHYKILPILITIFIILLSIYVYRQLNVYNNVTKMAQKIVEENNLKNTEKIYYMGESYTADNDKILFEYNLFDKSRKEIKGGRNFEKIQVDSNYIYGILSGILYRIDRDTQKKEKLSDKKISDYVISKNTIYLYIDSSNKKTVGVYIINEVYQKPKKIISGKIYQLLVDDKNIYAVMKGKTAKSIVRYDLRGNEKKYLTDDEKVSYINQNDNYIFYVNTSKGNKIYYLSKKGKKMGALSKNATNYSKGIEPYLNGTRTINLIEENIYYVGTKDKSLYMVNIKTKKETKLGKEFSNIDKIQTLGEKIYYSKQTDIGIYRYDVLSKENEKITSALQEEYVFIK